MRKVFLALLLILVLFAGVLVGSWIHLPRLSQVAFFSTGMRLHTKQIRRDKLRLEMATARVVSTDSVYLLWDVSLEVIPSFPPSIKLEIGKIAPDLEPLPVGFQEKQKAPDNWETALLFGLSKMRWQVVLHRGEFRPHGILSGRARIIAPRISYQFRLAENPQTSGTVDIEGKATVSNEKIFWKDQTVSFEKMAFRTEGRWLIGSSDWQIEGHSQAPKGIKVSMSGRGFTAPRLIQYEATDVEVSTLGIDEKKFPLTGLLSGQASQSGDRISGNLHVRNFRLKTLSFTEILKGEFKRMPAFAPLMSNDGSSNFSLSSDFILEKGKYRFSNLALRRREFVVSAKELSVDSTGRVSADTIWSPSLHNLPSPLKEVLTASLGQNPEIPANLSGTLNAPKWTVDTAAMNALGQKLKTGFLKSLKW